MTQKAINIFLTKQNKKMNKTEDPSVSYAGQGYVTPKKKVWQNYYKDKRTLKNRKEP